MIPRYALFGTQAGFCGLAWTNDGVVRFQLPGQSRDETERLLKRRLPCNTTRPRPGSPPPSKP